MIGYLKGICLSLIIVSCNTLWQSHNFSVFNIPCTSLECLDYVNYVTKSMNRNTNPCNDFYEYVCGHKKNPVPDYYPTWSTLTEMSLKSANNMRHILEDRLGADDSPALNKARLLYRACMKLPYVGMLNPSTTQSYVQNAGYFPLLSESGSGSQTRKSWVDIHNYYFALTSDAGLYEILSMADHHNNYKPLLHLKEVYSPFGRIKFSKKMKGVQRKLYAKYLTSVVFSTFSFTLLKVPHKILATRIEAIINFRCEIQAIKDLYSRIPPEAHGYDVMTVSELDHWYKSMSEAQYVIPIPWVDLIHSIYGESETEQTIKNMKINIVNKLYHKSLINLIEKTPNNVLVNHMHLYFIEKHLEFSNPLRNILMETILINGKMTGSVKYFAYKWHICILANSMDEAINKVYVQKYFPVPKKNRIHEFVTEIKDVLSLQIRRVKWLGSFLMNKFKVVVDDMKLAIGYPEYYDQESLRDGYNPIVEPGIPQASYCRELNRLSISASFFQTPIYAAKLPKTVLYGSIGAMIAHELYHVFGPSVFPQCYNFSLSQSTKSLYQKRVDCFLKKYDKLPVKEMKFLKPAPTIDGSRTLEENMADAMGLKLAYDAFRKDGWENKKCSFLPMLRGISCEQLFFIAFGVMHCSDVNSDIMLEDLMKGDHSTNRVRVNAAVSNMGEFATTFDCPKHSPMNTVERCNLWK